MGLEQVLQWNISLFLLVFTRWAGMVMLSPVFGARGVPSMIKLAFALSVTVILYPLVEATKPPIPGELLPYVGILIKEVLAGLVIGFMVYAITAVVAGAGQLMDLQMGFAMGSAIDPVFGMQSPMMGNFHVLLATMLLLATNAHHYLLAGMVKSYAFVPLNPEGLPQGIAFYIHLVRDIFTLSIQLAMPLMGVMFLSDLGVGLLSKAVPQLNIFSVIFPVKTMIGFVVLIMSVPFFGESVTMLFQKSMSWLLQLYKGWNL